MTSLLGISEHTEDNLAIFLVLLTSIRLLLPILHISLLKLLIRISSIGQLIVIALKPIDLRFKNMDFFLDYHGLGVQVAAIFETHVDLVNFGIQVVAEFVGF